VAKPKRRRAKRRRATSGRSRRSRSALKVSQATNTDHRPGLTGYRPRDELVPANLLDSLDRHISAATETESSLLRYLKLLHFGRSTALLLVGALLIGCLMFGAGISAAVMIAGLRPWTAIGAGATGSATLVVTAIFKGRGYLKAVVRALASVDQIDSLRDRRYDAEPGEQEASGW
jgi:hypothetical protein